MNVRTALGVVGVLELLTLIALGYYSSQLHELQGTRSVLVAREDELRRTLLSAATLPLPQPALPQFPRANSNQTSGVPPVSALNSVIAESRPSPSAATDAQASIKADAKTATEDEDDSLPPEEISLPIPTELDRADKPAEHSVAELSVRAQALDKTLHDLSVPKDVRNVADIQSANGLQPPLEVKQPPLPLPQLLQQPLEPKLHQQQPPPPQLQLSQLQAQPLASQVQQQPPPLQQQPPPLQQLASAAQVQVAAPSPKVPPSASAESWQAGEGGVVGQGGSGGEGEFVVSWHDGALHWRKFARYGDAADFFASISSDVAHRLVRSGQELKRHVWADNPWPPEWELPASAAAPPSAPLLPPAEAMASRQSGLEALLGGSSAQRPAPAGGGGAAWDLDRYAGMQPEGFGAAPPAQPAQPLPSAARGAAAGAFALGGGGGGAGGGGGGSVEQRQGALAAGLQGGRASERPEKDKVGAAQRVSSAEYVQSSEVLEGGGRRDGDDVSISTHLSVDRLDRLRCYLQRWAGPVVAAVYLRAPEERAAVQRLARELEAQGRRNFHLTLALAQQPQLYPANLLRNLALEPVQSRLVFLLDIDLVPDPGFYSYVMAHFAELAAQSAAAVFTIPAFNGVGGHATTPETFPVDKAEVVQMLGAQQLKPILSGENEFWAAFSCLNYDSWLASAQPYNTQYQWPCEPYLLAATAQVPWYDERFVHYGNDKAQHVLNIFYHQFSFIVLPDHFLVHWDHALAAWADQRKRDEHMGEVLELTEQFKFESGTEAGVNWHTGVKFAPGTYRVKNGKMIVWNGEEWIDQESGQATDPL